MDLTDLIEKVLEVPGPAERIRGIERREAWHTLVLTAVAGGLVVLGAALLRKGVLTPADLRVLADG